MDLGIGRLPWYNQCLEENKATKSIIESKIKFDIKEFCGAEYEFLYDIYKLVNENIAPNRIYENIIKYDLSNFHQIHNLNRRKKPHT